MDVSKLGSLLVDANELTEEQVISALSGRIAFDKKTYNMVFLPSFSKLSPEAKILSFLLAKKVQIVLKGEPTDTTSASPKEIQEKTGLAVGTANPKLRVLLQQRVIAQSETDKQYFIPDYALHIAIERISTQGGGQ